MKLIDLINIENKTIEDIKELVIFTAASGFIYNHFSNNNLNKDEVLKGISYTVKIEEIIERINNQSIHTQLYENVYIRAYGILDVCVSRVASLLINKHPLKYLKDQNISFLHILEGDIEKLKEGKIQKAINEFSMNKNAFLALQDLLDVFEIDKSEFNKFKKNITIFMQ